MDWKVGYVDYPKQFSNDEKEYMGIIREVLSKGDLMLRGQLSEFEEALAGFCGTGFAVGLSNCTDALFLALHAAGIGPGDEVITVSHTFVATASAIHHTGAAPVLVDIAGDHNMDAGLVEEAITTRTRAIIPVQLNGRICSCMDRIVEIAERYNLFIIEDSAQALGASYRGKKAGSFGTAGCFSFYPAKLLGAFGDGGALVTDDEDLALTIKKLRNHGRASGTEIEGWSFNCRMDNLQAAVLDYKLRRLPDWIRRRREIAAGYDEMLSGVEALRLPPPPAESGDHYDVFQNYEVEAEDRDGLARHLAARGIEVMLPWGGKGVHQHEALGLCGFRLPRTEELFKKAVMLPMYPELDDWQVEYVSDAVRGYYDGT